LLALAVLSVVALCFSVVVLGPGVVAVVYDPFTGSVGGPHVGPSAFLKAPWQGVVRGSCGVEVVELSGGPGYAGGPVAARTRDGVEVWVDLALAYSVDPLRFGELVRSYPGLDFAKKALAPYLEQAAREVVAGYTAEELFAARSRVSAEIREAFLRRVRADSSLAAVEVRDVRVGEIKLPPEVEQAIQDKVASYQRMLAEYYRRVGEALASSAPGLEQLAVDMVYAQAAPGAGL